MKVGEKIKDGAGNEWVIAEAWLNGVYTDYKLLHTETGIEGSLRIKTEFINSKEK
jgi:hypothetical protein